MTRPNISAAENTSGTDYVHGVGKVALATSLPLQVALVQQRPGNDVNLFFFPFSSDFAFI